MKVISLWQPWASLMALNIKHIETRSWDTKYRGPLLIHASKKLISVRQFIDEIMKNLTEQEKITVMRAICQAYGDYSKMPLGQIIAKTTLIDIRPTEFLRSEIDKFERAFGDYSDNRFGWITKGTERIEPIIPAKGQLGLWEFDIERALRNV